MNEGMRTLRQDGIHKGLAGLTVIEEVRPTATAERLRSPPRRRQKPAAALGLAGPAALASPASQRGGKHGEVQGQCESIGRCQTAVRPQTDPTIRWRTGIGG